jgi:hypothetical protein
MNQHEFSHWRIALLNTSKCMLIVSYTLCLWMSSYVLSNTRMQSWPPLQYIFLFLINISYSDGNGAVRRVDFSDKSSGHDFCLSSGAGENSVKKLGSNLSHGFIKRIFMFTINSYVPSNVFTKSPITLEQYEIEW